MQKPLSEEEIEELISDLLEVESKVYNLLLFINGDLDRPIYLSVQNLALYDSVFEL